MSITIVRIYKDVQIKTCPIELVMYLLVHETQLYKIFYQFYFQSVNVHGSCVSLSWKSMQSYFSIIEEKKTYKNWSIARSPFKTDLSRHSLENDEHYLSGQRHFEGVVRKSSMSSQRYSQSTCDCDYEGLYKKKDDKLHWLHFLKLIFVRLQMIFQTYPIQLSIL